MSTASTTGAPAGPARPAAGIFCGHCGQPDDGGGPAAEGHRRCAEQLTLEPPRYCAECKRRMKVQVTPTGWSAECSRHGTKRFGDPGETGAT